MKFATGHFEGDGGLLYLPIGFIPDYFMLCRWYTNTNCVFWHWWRAAELDCLTGYKEGISVAEGVTATLADAGGITAYDGSATGPTVVKFAVMDQPTARSATVHGTYVSPSGTYNNVDGVAADRSAIFECVTSTAAVTATTQEPGYTGLASWPVVAGAQVTDGVSNVWELVKDVSLGRKGYQGVCIAAALLTDARENFYNAFGSDEPATDWGDTVGWTGGIHGA